MILLDGKKVAESIYSKLLLDISLLSSVPRMVFVLVGEDPASQTYVKSKTKKCQDLGIRGETLALPGNISEEDLVSRIRSLSRDKDVHGILVQLPLPAHINRTRVLREIEPIKDVDGLHPENVGRLSQGDPRFVPCTPGGILELLKFYQIPIEGSGAVIVGRSEIVGKPMAQLLINHSATVTVCHSKTRNLSTETARADILIVAMGKPKFIGVNQVKEGAVVVDVGIHRLSDRIVGDVDFENVQTKVSAISPVPGGVGPLTIAMLMKNVVHAAMWQSSHKG